MAKFQDLGGQVLSTIARRSVQGGHVLLSDNLKLLPLRLIHPRFTSSVTHWIFHTVHVKANGDPECGHLQWIKAKSFLRCMEVPVFRSQVTHLTFKMKWPARDWEACIATLLAVSQTVERIHLRGKDIFPAIQSVEGSEKLLAAYLRANIVYYCLTDLVLGGFYMPLLPRLLSQSPKLERLCIGDDPAWHPPSSSYAHLVPVWDQAVTYPLLQLLCVNNASEYAIVDFLKRLPFSATSVKLSISSCSRSDTLSLVDAIRGGLFMDVKVCKIAAENPGDRYIEALRAVLYERDISVSVERIKVQAVDAANVRERPRRGMLWKWRVPLHIRD